MGIPFRDSPLLLLVPRTYFRWYSCWNFTVSTSELIPFVARLDRFCYSRSAEIPSRGFLLVFPRWGFTLIFCLQGTQFPPVGGLLFFSFLGELHTDQICDVAPFLEKCTLMKDIPIVSAAIIFTSANDRNCILALHEAFYMPNMRYTLINMN